MIRVTANLAWLVPGGVGGSEEYTIRLLRAVIQSAPADIELRIVGSADLRATYPELGEVPYSVIPGPLGSRPYRVVAESTLGYARTAGADVVHHFGGRVPTRRHGNDIVTIHDLQPLDMPENFSFVKRHYLQWALPRSVRAARAICVPSHWVAASVVQHFGIDPDRVRAVSSTWDQAAPAPSSLPEVAGPVVLYPAMTHPHKNHLVLLEAVDRLGASHPELTLVLTGAAGRADADVAARIGRSRVRVLRTGRVPAETLGAWMARADVLAFPSRYEGFGLPVLEAMRMGTPVVAADATALPEVVGDAGILVDPDDIEGWVAALGDVLGNAGTRARLRGAADAHLAGYAPQAAASRLVEMWRAAAV
ncbi:MAG: glycosyltransferase family 1 protein [Acidimicrobiales bacterium]